MNIEIEVREESPAQKREIIFGRVTEAFLASAALLVGALLWAIIEIGLTPNPSQFWSLASYLAAEVAGVIMLGLGASLGILLIIELGAWASNFFRK